MHDTLALLSEEVLDQEPASNESNAFTYNPSTESARSFFDSLLHAQTSVLDDTETSDDFGSIDGQQAEAAVLTFLQSLELNEDIGTRRASRSFVAPSLPPFDPAMAGRCKGMFAAEKYLEARHATWPVESMLGKRKHQESLPEQDELYRQHASLAHNAQSSVNAAFADEDTGRFGALSPPLSIDYVSASANCAIPQASPSRLGGGSLVSTSKFGPGTLFQQTLPATPPPDDILQFLSPMPQCVHVSEQLRQISEVLSRPSLLPGNENSAARQTEGEKRSSRQEKSVVRPSPQATTCLQQLEESLDQGNIPANTNVQASGSAEACRAALVGEGPSVSSLTVVPNTDSVTSRIGTRSVGEKRAERSFADVDDRGMIGQDGNPVHLETVANAYPPTRATAPRPVASRAKTALEKFMAIRGRQTLTQTRLPSAVEPVTRDMQQAGNEYCPIIQKPTLPEPERAAGNVPITTPVTQHSYIATLRMLQNVPVTLQLQDNFKVSDKRRCYLSSCTASTFLHQQVHLVERDGFCGRGELVDADVLVDATSAVSELCFISSPFVFSRSRTEKGI